METLEDSSKDTVLDTTSTPKRSLEEQEDSTSLKRQCFDGDVIVIDLVNRESNPNASTDTAIIMLDDLTNNSFSCDFDIYNSGSPAEQANRLALEVNHTYWFQLEQMQLASAWLQNHIHSTKHAHQAWRFGYMADTEFWIQLFRFMLRLLETDDPFDPGATEKYDQGALGDCLYQFCADSLDLSLRFVGLVDRYHSGEPLSDAPSALSQLEQFIAHTHAPLVAAKLTSGSPFMLYLNQNHHLDLKQMQELLASSTLRSESILLSIVQLLSTVAAQEDNVQSNFHCIRGLLKLLPYALPARLGAAREADHESYLQCFTTLKELLSIFSQSLLPSALKLHAKTVGNGYHYDIISAVASTLHSCLPLLYLADVDEMFDSVANSLSSDGSDSWRHLRQSIDLSQHSGCDTVQLLWTLNAHMRLVRAEIMDLRTTGILMLREELGRWLERGVRDSAQLKFACKVIMQCRLPHHIFGPETHATLLNEVKDMMILIAKTKAWNEDLTDCIWTAWTNSTHDEYKKVVGDIIFCCFREMQDSWPITLLEKYESTPVERYSCHELRLLNELLSTIDEKKCEPGLLVKQCQLAAEISFAMLVHHTNVTVDPAFFHVACCGITKVIHSSEESAVALYENCAACIGKQTMDASAAWEVYRLSSQFDQRYGQALQPVRFLPLQDAVAEFSTFVERGARLPATSKEKTVQNLQTRIEVMLRLLDLQDGSRDTEEEASFWECAIGKNALDHAARDQFLHLVLTLQSSLSHPRALLQKLNHHLAAYTAIMSPRSATGGLVKHLGNCIKQEIIDADIDKLSILMEDWQWKQLVHLACTITDDAVRTLALNIICDCLFALPAKKSEAASTAVKISHFIKQEMLSLKLARLDNCGSPAHSAPYLVGKLALFGYVLKHSSNRPSTMKTIVLCDNDVAGATQDFAGKLHGLPGMEKALSQLIVKLSPSARCRQLFKLLEEYSGAIGFDVIVGGTTKRLSSVLDMEVGNLWRLGEPLIRVTYTPDADFTKRKFDTDEVEITLQQYYTELESLLDLSSPEGESAYNLLHQIRPPAYALERLLDVDLACEALFPAASPWRCVHYVSLLRRHLEERSKYALVPDELVQHSMGLFLQLNLQKEYHKLLHCRNLAVGTILWGLEQQQCKVNTASTPQSNMMMRTKAFLSVQIGKSPQIAIHLLDLLEIRKEFSNDAFNDVHLATLHGQVYELICHLVSIDSRIASPLILSQSFSSYHRRLYEGQPEICGVVEPLMLQLTGVLTTEAMCQWIHTMLAIATEHLRRHDRSAAIWACILQVYVTRGATSISVTERRDLLAILTSALWCHRHREHPDIGLQDEDMHGLLKLINLIVFELSHPEDRRVLEGLAIDIFTRLLFPLSVDVPFPDTHNSGDGHPQIINGCSNPTRATGAIATSLHYAGAQPTQSYPLLGQDTRGLCLSIVNRAIHSEAALECLSEHLTSEISQLPIDILALRPQNVLRQPLLPAGLTNLGMTCYMNSLLQQIYGNLPMRKLLMNADVTPSDDDQQQLLALLQDLFAKMQHGKAAWCNTGSLAHHMRIATEMQEDVHSFWTVLLSAIEQAFVDLQTRKDFNALYTGQLLSQVCGACGHISSRTEDFSDIPLTVQNKSSLSDSLAEFVQGETMRGADCYKCTTCDPDKGGRLVEAVKRTCLKVVPNTIVLCLKRFTFNLSGRESKNNDLFMFPETIDMAPYQLQNIESPSIEKAEDLFRLTGVIVHSGTMSFGHYWSYLLRREAAYLGGPQWYRLEDRKVDAVAQFSDLETELFGGNDRSHSAYVLFYERQSVLDEAVLDARIVESEQPDMSLLPLRVALPQSVIKDISTSNLVDVRINNVFANDLQSLLQNMTEHVGLPLKQSTLVNNDEDHGNELAESGPSHDCHRKLANLAVLYARQVLLIDSDPSRLETFSKVMSNLMLKNSSFAVDFLESWTKQKDFFWVTYCYCREQTLMAVIKALATIKAHHVESYDRLLKLVLTKHEDLIRTSKIDEYYPMWQQYFIFVKQICELGHKEVGIVLKMLYLPQALNMINTIPARQEQAQQTPYYRSNGIRIEPSFNDVFDFLQDILQSSRRGIGDADHDLFTRSVRQITTPQAQNSIQIIPWIIYGAALDSPMGINHAITLFEILINCADDALEDNMHSNLLYVVSRGRTFTLDTMYGFVKAYCLHTNDNMLAAQLIKALAVRVFEDSCLPQEELLEMIDEVARSRPEIVMITTMSWLEVWLKPKSRIASQASTLLRRLLNVDQQTDHAQAPIDSSMNELCVSHSVDVISWCARTLQSYKNNGVLPGNWTSVRLVLSEALLQAQRFEKRVTAIYEECDNLNVVPPFSGDFNDLHTKLNHASSEGDKVYARFEQWRTHVRVVHDDSIDEEPVSSDEDEEEEEE